MGYMDDPISIMHTDYVIRRSSNGYESARPKNILTLTTEYHGGGVDGVDGPNRG